MKSKLWMILLVVVLSLALAGTGLAQEDEDYGLTVVKGNVLAFDGASISVESVKGGTFVFALPAELALPAVALGDQVMVKGQAQADGSLVAVSVHVFTKPGQGKGAGTGDPAEAGKLNRAFCDANKQASKFHPLAPKLAQRFGTNPEWVMGYYCDGQSMGAIMLALKTAQMQGGDADALLARRANGDSWGLIWQELGLIGSEKDVKTPPGQLKK